MSLLTVFKVSLFETLLTESNGSRLNITQLVLSYHLLFKLPSLHQQTVDVINLLVVFYLHPPLSLTFFTRRVFSLWRLWKISSCLCVGGAAPFPHVVSIGLVGLPGVCVCV